MLLLRKVDAVNTSLIRSSLLANKTKICALAAGGKTFDSGDVSLSFTEETQSTADLTLPARFNLQTIAGSGPQKVLT